MLKESLQVMFDNLMFAADDAITIPTAERLAREIGVEFDPLDYDH